ncbi:MAG TPA: helix-turn-helix transcriptional regulator [Chloroflexota bacterium]
MADLNPTIRRRELGMRLREFRTAKRLTVEDVAKELLCSPTKISRAETGARRATLRDVRDLCKVYGVDTETSAELMELAREARQPGWWTKYDDLKIAPLIGMEQAATAITSFGMYFFPALLQSEEYARAIIKGIAPKIDEGILSQRVEARMIRQKLLLAPKPPKYRVLLDEAVLHRHVGGPAVMKAQLDNVLSLMREEKAAVQVIPYEVGAYGASDSNFSYLEFAGTMLPDLVFVEGLVSQLYLERPDELDRYREALDYLRDEALNPRDSAKRIEEIRNKF